MAKQKSDSARTFVKKAKRKLGRHAKRISKNKSSKNYQKPYAGQGR
jgi:hypothetical protein